MNSSECKEICSKPNILTKKVLERTLVALKKECRAEATLVEGFISGKAIPFPENYTGSIEQCYFKVSCTEQEAEAIIDLLLELEASSVPVGGIASEETCQYVELVNLWSELTEYIGQNI